MTNRPLPLPKKASPPPPVPEARVFPAPATPWPEAPLYSAEIVLQPKAGQTGFTLRCDYHRDPAQTVQSLQPMLTEALDFLAQIQRALAAGNV